MQACSRHQCPPPPPPRPPLQLNHRGDMDSPISLELVYIKTALTVSSPELVFFGLGPGVAARISIRLPPSINQPRAARQRELPQKSLLPPSINQPRAAGAPPGTAPSHHDAQSGSPAQRKLPQNNKEAHPPSFNQAAPRSGSSPIRKSILPPSINQPRAAGTPP